jgi:hypothetical protein
MSPNFKFFWCSFGLAIAAWLLGYCLEWSFSCVGDWKSYRPCLVLGRNIASLVYGLKGYSFLYVMYGLPIVGALSFFTFVVDQNRKPD